MSSFLVWLLWVLFWFVVVALVTFCVLAIKNTLTCVKESTAKAIVRGGTLRKMLFSKRGYRLDADDNLVEDKTQKGHWYGGWRIIGIPWLDKVYTYDWAWVKVKQDSKQGSILVPKEEEGTSFIIVGQVYFYGNEIRGTDVVDKDLIPVEASFALPAMIVNPRKAKFDTTDWFGSFCSSIEPAERNFINAHSYKEIIADSKIDLGQEVFNDLVAKSVVKRLEDDYGVRLLRVECKGIRLAGDYQKSQTEKWQAERDAERDRTKRLGSTTGVLMDMIADQTGLELKDIRAEFRTNPDAALKKYKGLIDMNKDFIEQQIASDAGVLKRYYFKGGNGGLDLIALFGDVFRGNVAPSPAEKPKSSDKLNKRIEGRGKASGNLGDSEKPAKDMTDDELAAELGENT